MKLYAKVIAILALPLIFVVAYALCPIQLPPPGWTLSKLHITNPHYHESPTQNSVIEQAQDSCVVTEEADTSQMRILFFGDSMAEGLVRRMADYAQENEYELVRVIWYNSTTKLWATTDTLQHYIQKYRPTFYMVCIGGNEQFLKKPYEKYEYIQQIIKKMEGKPFVWIGIPTWKGDTGFNNMVQQCVGTKQYFDSRRLALKRGSDHVHPTFGAARLWMDSIAVWMQNQHTIKMSKPTKEATQKYPLHLLQPVKQ